MNIRPIRTDQEHRAALEEIETLWGATEGSPEGDKLDVLVALVDIYEEKRLPFAVVAPDSSGPPRDIGFWRIALTA